MKKLLSVNKVVERISSLVIISLLLNNTIIINSFNLFSNLSQADYNQFYANELNEQVESANTKINVKILAKTFVSNFYSNEYFTKKLSKHPKTLTIISETDSENNIRYSTFLNAHISTST